MLMVEHHMDVVTGLADRIAVMHHGALLACRHPGRGDGERDRAGGLPGGAAVSTCRATRPARGRDLHVHLGAVARPPGRLLRRPRGRRHRAARAQRRRQDDDAARACSASSPRARHGRARRARTSRSCRRTGSSAAASATCPRTATSSPGSPSPENLRLAERAAQPRYDLVYELFPELRERGAPARRHALGRPAADGRDRPRAAERQPAPARRRADEGPRADARDRGRRRARAASRADDGPARRAEPRRRPAPRRDAVVLDQRPGRARGRRAELLADRQRVRGCSACAGSRH